MSEPVSDVSTGRATDSGLRRNSVGLGGAVIMSAAIMGPAVSTFFNPQYSTPFSGAATPFVYLVCLVAILIAASGIIMMSARLPSAGAFFTFVTRGLGPKSGLVTGGLTFVAYALLPPAEIGLIGSYLQSTFRTEFDVNVPWWLIGLVPAGLMIFLAFEGIRSSLRAALLLFTAEVVVIVVLAVIIVGKGGAHGLSGAPLTPTASPHGFQGIVTGAVFAALSFVGFEAAATLGEEVRAPRRTVPRAILVSVVAVGALYLFCVWAEVIGLGTAKTNALTAADTPWNELAATFAPWMKWFVIVASVSSMFAVMVNSNNGIVRVLFAMGRESLLPRFLAHIDPRRHTPSRAVLAQGVFAIVLALVVGAVSGGLGDPVGGGNVYGYLGFLLTLGVLPIYALTNVAAIRYFRRIGEFQWLRHGVLPTVGALLMVGLLVGQIVEQTTAPYTWFPWVIVAWVVLVAIGAVLLERARPAVVAVAGGVFGAEADEELVVAQPIER
ncbi:MAG TPA: APC family permease [Pseudonocardiaceae bacterium]|jgi:amino acid transporter|nr:APC family permease [Pseudonocardiaceae bacterium]